MEKLTFVLITIAAAAANGFQAPINAALGKYTGTVESSCISFTGGALSLFIVAMVMGKGSILKFVEAPPYLWIGGILGALLVTTMLVVVTRIGAAGMISSVITGQMLAALIIDQIGFLGVPKNPIDIYRVGGILFLAVGVKLLTR
jgi:transporter family-2 protein